MYIANSRFILPLNIVNLEEGQGHHDSIVVYGKYYYDVFSDSCDYFFPSGDSSNSVNYLTTMFYNTAHGLLKLDFSDGETWELKEIIYN